MLIKSRILTLTLFAALFASSCDRVSSPTAPLTAGLLPEGHWSSSQMCLDVASSSVSIAAGCGRGSLPRPLLNDRGTFTADGTFTISVGPPPPSSTPSPAQFTGTVEGDTVTVTVKNGTQTFGTWKATRGSGEPCPVACP